MELPQNDGVDDTSPNRWSGLQVRFLTALAFACLALLCLWKGGIVFIVFMLVALLVAKKEYDALTRMQPLIVRLLGYFYTVLPCACLLWLRDLTVPGDALIGYRLVVALVALIAATDTAAYFVGRSFGKRKLAPAISPNKTWEGLGGGIIAAIVIGITLSPGIHVEHSWTSAVLISILIALVAQIGDLFESALKRKAGVKDSGTLLPGHGGLLDRVDGYMFAAPVFALLVYIALQHQPAAAPL